MAKKKITELVGEWLKPFGSENGYELSRCEFVKEAGTWYLRVYIDKTLENGEYGWVSSDDCEKVSRYLSDILDREDPVKQNYYLEVSSPGLDRPLITEKDYIRFAGSLVDVKLYEAIDGRKTLTGRLLGLEDGVITITDDSGRQISLPKDKAAKVNLAIEF